MTISSAYDSTVNSFYLAFYGRPADPDGLKFWSKQLAANNGDMGAIVEFFATSEEAQVRFGTDTVADRINEIYSQLFNRTPDADGLAFWTKAIEHGHASLVDVAISIFNGAQGSDATLAQLRQQAVDAFTAKVEADGSLYDGYASIEAARILVRAVTPDATAADLDALVNAAVSFADTATKTPQVVEAIAVNTTLLALFDTARGVQEPVGLAQALADTAKAAAGDPATLESLLRGGGMDKVLKVMPAKATLQDVVKALAEGGLPAAVEVVYPSAPTTPSVPPAPSYKLSFVSVTEGKDDAYGKADAKADHVTRKQIVDVTFGYRGNDLTSGQSYEYRINGGEWISGKQHIQVDTSANTVVLKHIDLSQGLEPIGPKSIGIMDAGPAGDLLSNIELRAVRSDKSVIDAFTQQIVYDQDAARPWVAVTVDNKAAPHFDGGWATRIPQLIVEDLEQGARVEYSLVTNQHNRLPVPDKTEWSSKLPDLSEDGDYTILVRQIDLAGNISDERSITFTLDREKPLEPTIALEADTGIPGDGVTNDARIKITQLELSTNTAWEYRVDGGEWQFGERNDGSGSAVLELEDLDAGKVEVQVRQFDAAGNIGDASSALSFTFDATPPAYAIDFARVQQGKNDRAPDDTITNVESAYVEFSYTGAVAEGLYFQYSTDDGKNWLTTDLQHADGVVTISNIDLTAGSPAGNPQGRMSIMEAEPLDNLFTTIRLQLVDANAFVYASASETVELDRFAEMPEVSLVTSPLAAEFGQDGAGRTRVPSLTIDGLEQGGVAQYLDVSNLANANITTWTEVMPALMDGTHTFKVRQRDESGNLSDEQLITFTLDRSAPEAPSIHLDNDTGSDDGDGITSDGKVIIEILDSAPDTGWQYSVDEGKNWIFGERNGLTGTAELDLSTVGVASGKLTVRQVDAAGNTGTPSNALNFVLDKVKPTETLSFVRIEGEEDGVLVTDKSSADLTFGIGLLNDGIVQWRVAGESAWTTVDAGAIAEGVFTLSGIDLASADPTIEMRVIDLAGNIGHEEEWTIDGAYSAGSVTVKMTPAGLRVESTAAGIIKIGGVVVESDHDSKGAIAGKVVVGQQGDDVSGVLTVTLPGGRVLTDGSGNSFTLGSSAYDELGGSNLWGFAGYDTLTGTAGDDYLSGGADNDTLYGEGGNDTIVGGKEGDTIFLGSGPGNSTIVVEAGDTRLGILGSGDYLSGTDRINGAKLGDAIKVGRIFDDLPIVGTKLLSDDSLNQVAVVRGSTDGSRFHAGDNGNSYLLQWTDANGINSVFFNNFGAAGFALDIDTDRGTMTLIEPPPVVSLFAGINYRFSHDESGFWLRGDPDDVIQADTDSGLLDSSGVTLHDFLAGTPRPLAIDYTDGAKFGVDAHGYLNFDSPLATGVYMAMWGGDTFATASGVFDSGAIAFAGGVTGKLFQEVFNLERAGAHQQLYWLDDTVIDNGAGTRSYAYAVAADAKATVTTGGRKDVIDAAGGDVTIRYGKLDSKAQDLVFHFGAGDRIAFAYEGFVKPGVLAFQAQGRLATNELPYTGTATMATLKYELDGLVVNKGGVLLLVQDELDDHAGMLLHYTDADGDLLATPDEITLIATFVDGLPTFDQIDLVGMNPP